jgi:class 3 adenylate cyclase
VQVLVVEDDAGMRSLITHVLERRGCKVLQAAHGGEALGLLRAGVPDLLISDVHMPVVDGFRLLEAVRADAALARLPVVLVTAFSDREGVVRGMRLGADDFLAKPVRPAALIEAVDTALDKRRRMSAVLSQLAMPEPQDLRARYLRAGREAAPRVAAGPAGTTGRMLTQTVLFTDIRGFTSMAERLSAREVAELLSSFLNEACAPIVRERGRVMKIMGDGLMALFGQDCPEDGVAHAAASLRAARQIVAVAREFRGWAGARFDLRGLPPFDVGVGIHTGPVMLFRLSAGGSGDLTAVGDTVNVAARLEAMSKELRWPIVASVATIALAGASSQLVETRALRLAGRDGQIAVGRLRDVPARAPRAAALSCGTKAILEESARSTADAAKAATRREGGKRRPAGASPNVPLCVPGYRLLAKLGEGGRSSVFLAEERASRRKVVLEVPKAERPRAAAVIASPPADSC